MRRSMYFQSFTSVSTSFILMSTLGIMEVTVALIENESRMGRSFDIVDSSISEEEDDTYIRDVLEDYQPFRQLGLPPQGVNQLADGDNIVIWSPNYPEKYQPNDFQKWIFKPVAGAKLFLYCPLIRIRYSPKCRENKLAVFGGRRLRKGERRCGRINNYRATFDSAIKVIFSSNDNVDTITGYFCNITCQKNVVAYNLVPPTTTTSTTTTTTTSTSTTTTTTTTFMPGCHLPHQSANPKPVTSCSDLDPEHSTNCVCVEEDCGELTLECTICTLCDMDVLGAHDLSIAVNLKFSFICPYPMSLSGYYGVNADDVVSFTVCVTENLENVDIAFEDLSNLHAVVYKDCNRTSSGCIHTACGQNDVCQIYEPSRALHKTDLQRDDSPIYITIPSASLAGVKELYITDVCVNLTVSPLAIESMEKLCISEATGCTEMIPNSLDCPNLLQVNTDTCQADADADTFNIISPDIECLDITLPCTHNLDENFIVLDAVTCNQNVTLRINFNENFYKNLPHCPFHNFIEKGCIDIVVTTMLQCRECGNYWLGKISPSMLSRVHGNCYEAVTGQTYTLQEYFTQFTHPCDFIPLQTC